MSRHNEQAFGQVIAKGVDNTVGSVLKLAKGAQRGMNDDCIGGKDSHGFDLFNKIIFGKHIGTSGWNGIIVTQCRQSVNYLRSFVGDLRREKSCF